MLTNRTSRWSFGAALLCVLLLVATWFLLISPRRADAADVRVQVSQSDSAAAELNVKITELKAQFADLPKQKSKLKAIRTQLPPDASIPAFVRQLQSLAAQSGVSLDSITPGAPVVLGGTPGVATKAGAGSLIGVPMAVVVTGDYFETSLFVKSLQTKIQRSYLITGFSAAPADTATTATPTPTVAATASATASAAPTPTSTPAAALVTLDTLTLTLNGSVFVLLDGTSTLDDVTKDAAAAAAATGKATATPAATSTAPAAASTATTN